MIEQLSIFNWNVRGLNAPLHREVVRFLVQLVNPKLVCLQETKLSLITLQLATETLGQRFNDYKYLRANGTRGGILLGWHSDFIEASNLLLKQFSLSMMTVWPTWEVSPFLLTMVYSPTEDVKNSEFLDELLSVSPRSHT
jgi:exonuclease III